MRRGGICRRKDIRDTTKIQIARELIVYEAMMTTLGSKQLGMMSEEMLIKTGVLLLIEELLELRGRKTQTQHGNCYENNNVSV